MHIIKLQVFSMFFLVSIFYYYGKSRKIKTSHDFLYKAMMVNLFINIIFDIITVYTVNNIEEIPYYINDAAHRIFIFTLDLFVFLLYLYMRSYARCKRNSGRVWIAVSVMPITISFIISMFGPVYYMQTEGTNYCYGPVVNTVYVSMVFYIMDTFYYYIRYKKDIDKNIISGILRAAIIEVATGIIQYFMPTILISSGGQIMVIFTLFLSFENTAEFVDKKTGILNENAFFKVLNDKVNRNKSCYVVTAYADEEDENKNNETLIEIDKEMRKVFNTEVYCLYSGCFSIIADNTYAKDYFLSKINGIRKENILVHTLPDKQSNAEMIIADIEKFDNKLREQLRYFDESTGVRNRNAYERKVNELNVNNSKKDGLWGIIVDVNNLKKTNDTYGHDKGDHLIQMTARILIETFCDSNKVYRIGGDEFAVLLENYSLAIEGTIIKLIKRKQNKYNEKEPIQIEFSIGIAYFNNEKDLCVEDMMKRADRNMYDNKKIWYSSRGENARNTYN